MTDKTILFVDDEPIMRRLLVRSLSPYFDVLEAESVSAALIILEKFENDIGIVVTDMKMPDGDGILLVEKMFDQFSSIPIVVCTGDLSFCDFDALIGEGKIAAVIEKPMTAEQAIKTIKSVLSEDASTI
jgi:two-component system response regulator HydG